MLALKNASEEGTADSKPFLRKTYSWWQWLLIYPTLIVTIISSVPTYLELFRSYKIGVPYGQSALAKQQHELWSKNFTCTKAPLNWVLTENNYAVDATICKSGDILIWVKGPRGEPRYTWVPVDGIINKNERASLISSANAQNMTVPSETYQSGGRVICQKFIGNGRLLRRIQVNNSCIDQIVNTYTGKVIQQYPSPSCSPNC